MTNLKKGRIFVLRVYTDSGPAQPLFWWTLGVKKPGNEADHSPLSSAEVKNEWSYTSTTPTCLHVALVLVIRIA